ncbi:MAG: type II secretion system protein [Pseudomonadota bacterium]
MRQRGFTYLGLMILITVIGLVGAAGLKMGTLLQRAAAEEELLEIGAQFSEALRSYAAATPQGQPQQPPSLRELLKDPRFPNPRRHLRKIFVDPVTGKAEWGIIYLGDKVGVIGVYSLSNRRPLKVANFDIRFPNMENRERISDWKFLMAGGEGVNPAVLTAPNSMTGASTAPPSLFAPGTPDPKAPQPNQPAPMPPEQEPGSEPAPEPDPGQPMEAPAEERQDGEQPVNAEETSSPAGETVVSPKPAVSPTEGQKLKR